MRKFMPPQYLGLRKEILILDRGGECVMILVLFEVSLRATLLDAISCILSFCNKIVNR